MNYIEHMEAALNVIEDELQHMSPNERLELFSRITGGYCKHCGTYDAACQCWNDE